MNGICGIESLDDRVAGLWPRRRWIREVVVGGKPNGIVRLVSPHLGHMQIGASQTQGVALGYYIWGRWPGIADVGSERSPQGPSDRERSSQAQFIAGTNQQ
jgi:hypothetical protein